MKIRGLVLIMVAVAFAFAPAKLNAQDNYAVKLTSPVAGQVLYAGQKIMVEWKQSFLTSPWRDVRARFGCRWMAAVRFPRGLRGSPQEYIFPLDCSEHAYQRGGPGHPLRV